MRTPAFALLSALLQPAHGLVNPVHEQPALVPTSDVTTNVTTSDVGATDLLTFQELGVTQSTGAKLTEVVADGVTYSWAVCFGSPDDWTPYCGCLYGGYSNGDKCVESFGFTEDHPNYWTGPLNETCEFQGHLDFSCDAFLENGCRDPSKASCNYITYEQLLEIYSHYPSGIGEGTWALSAWTRSDTPHPFSIRHPCC